MIPGVYGKESFSMDYRDALRYLYSFLNFEAKTDYVYREDFHLKRVRWLLRAFGNPQKKLRFVLVGGTKGKGSTACILASILSSAGYRPGLYTSPHLNDVRERIRIGGVLIPKKDFAAIFRKIRIRLTRGAPPSFGAFTFFEVLTVAAILYFFSRKADPVILEVGLGGRLDATNAVDPLVSVLTPVSYDHMDKLGRSLLEIAGEKKAIMREKGFLICARQPASVGALLKEWACRRKVEAFFSGRDFRSRADCLTEFGSSFGVRSGKKRLRHLFLPLAGKYQIENAACAVQAAEVLALRRGFRIGESAIRKGLLNASWDGRFQILHRYPPVIADGAHNGASMRALRESLRAIFPGRPVTVILGISNDKDLPRILRELILLRPERIFATQAGNVRAMPAPVLAGKIAARLPRVRSVFNLKEAMDDAMRNKAGRHLVLITGSLFLVGEALNFWNSRSGCSGTAEP